VPRVGSTALKEVVPWRWTVGRPPHGRSAMQCGDTASDERMGPNLPRGRSKSIHGDLDMDDEGSKQDVEPFQSLHHCSISYQSV
jgi:hypothetical protein